METIESYKSWTISEEFWEAVKEDIPKRERAPNKKYIHAPGQGAPSEPVSGCRLYRQ